MRLKVLLSVQNFHLQDIEENNNQSNSLPLGTTILPFDIKHVNDIKVFLINHPDCGRTLL
jgi:hypothetical protein